jgi:ankyrin repeat protein
MKSFILTMLAAGVLLAGSPVDPLFQALRQGDEGKVRTAIELGFDVNSPDDHGNTLLMQAAIYSSRAMVEFLLAHGANPKAANDAGHTALMRALPDLGKIQVLVEHGANVKAATSHGDTLLIMAATIPAHEDLLRYLIAKGANLDDVNRDGSTAVVMASTEGLPGNLKILLDAGAHTDARRLMEPRQPAANATANALERAARNRTLDGTTPLMIAANVGCDACVRMLLEKGSDARARNGAGATALHGAAFQGDVTMVRRLLEAGAEVNVAESRGFTPLMMAANSRNKNPDVPRLLLAKGADATAKDKAGRSVADWARTGARPEIVKLFAGESAETAGAVQAKATSNAADLRGSVQKSLALLDRTAPNFFRKTGCISCHSVSIPMVAFAEARRRNYEADAVHAQQMMKEHAAVLAGSRENLLSGYCTVPGFSSSVGYDAIAMHSAGYQPDTLTDSIVRCLLVRQLSDGQWKPEGAPTRPPLSPSTGIPGTAMAARTLKLYSVPAFSREIDERVKRARAYLETAKPVVGDDYAYRLLGLFWSGAAQGQLAAAARELLSQQRSDGGWAQTTDRQSDAYATGLALAALWMADELAVHSAPYRRGVDYLMRTQEADGSWHVQTRAFPFQPYFESGFPHGEDQWISTAATAWSALALMPVPERQKIAAK